MTRTTRMTSTLCLLKKVKEYVRSFNPILLGVKSFQPERTNVWKTVEFLGAKAPLGIAKVKKGDEKVSELNDFIMVVK